MPLHGPLKTVALINPNISSDITDDMVAIAQQSARGRLEIVGLTAPFGARLITCQAELDEEIPTFDVPDDALERAASGQGQAATWVYCTHPWYYCPWPQ